MRTEPGYLRIARKDVGIKEIKGPQHHPRILEWLTRLKAWWRDDETPWCGVALAGWLAEAGLPYPRAYYRALEWADYGRQSTAPLLGAIAVLSRTGGGHVGIVTGVSGDRSKVRLLGGNQSDAVCEAWFDATRVVSYRLPLGVECQPAPLAAVGTMSVSEA